MQIFLEFFSVKTTESISAFALDTNNFEFKSKELLMAMKTPPPLRLNFWGRKGEEDVLRDYDHA